MEQYLPTQHIRPLPQHLPSNQHNIGGLIGGEPEHSEVNLREYLKLLFKYRVVIAASIAAGFILSAIYAFTATPRFTAQSRVRISTYEPVLTATKIEDMLQARSKETNYLETQIEEIRSLSLGDKVLEDPAIRGAFEGRSSRGFLSRILSPRVPSVEDIPETVEVVSGYKAPIGQIKAYLGSISVKPIRRTSLVDILATSENPNLAAAMANRHAQAYIEWVRANRIDQQSRGLQFLRTQSEELREKVADLERERADYAEANSIVAVNKDENITAQRMSQLNELLTAATSKRIEAEHTYAEANSALSSSSAGFDDSSLQVMRSELAKLEGEFQLLSAKFTLSYPKLQQLKAQIDGLKQSIERQRKQIVLGLKAKAQAALEEERNLKEELEQQKSKTFELSKKEVQYNVLTRELTSSRELLENVLRQIKETALAVESNASNVSIVDFAIVPKAPSYPRRSLIMMVGLCMGAGLGFSLAFLLSYLDNTIRTPEQITDLLKLPSLGVVPSFGLETLSLPNAANANTSASQNGTSDLTPAALNSDSNSFPIVYITDPKSLASEAYRTIRTGILLSQAGEPPRTILVSSAQSSEGKTTSSINMAASLASAGGRVILIDADLRRPSVYRHFQLDESLPGLVEVITGQKTIEEVSLKDLIKRVTVIPCGRIPPNPAELLGSLEMATLIDRLSAEFDYVLIDSPPVLPVTDSVILSRYVDGVVLVVKGASTPKKVVMDARNRLKAVGARILGVVLNNVDVTGGDYYYYHRYYHAYYKEDVARQSAKRAASS